jgi:hypothetical protein
MANKIQGGQLVFTVGDDGTLKLLEQKTKKASKSMKELGGASQNTDRRIKGVTQQSSNATKNFSKQAQTMQGGIVAVYATIAAQVFAVSAAFQFLKDSFETRNLIQGQLAFGAVTGVAYKTMTADIQKATSGMIQFKEAAQAAAIGTAAGLSSGQMEAIGTAAKNTSLALGRDLTDSFNRLTRGITKAEPELLDELGIILRLEPAMKAYANSIGKSAKDLTQFEKSQAVANEVLSQAESKFGAITKVLDPSAFALAQFGKSFDDMMKGVKETVGDIAAVVLPFFSKNIYALVGALTLFLAPILKSILPDFAAMGQAASTNYKIAAAAAREAADEAARAKAALSGALGGEGPTTTSKSANDYMEKNDIKGGKGLPVGQLSKQQIKMRRAALKGGYGFAKNMNKMELRDYRRFLTNQDIALNASLGKRQGFITRQAYRARAIYAGTAAFYAKTQVGMVRVTAIAAKGMNAAMKMMGWIGIALMIFEAVKALYTWIKGVDEAAEAEKKLVEDITNRYGGLTVEIKKMNDIAKMGLLGFKGTIEQMGSAFQSVDLGKTMGQYGKALAITDSKGKAEAISKITGSLKELSELTQEPKVLLELIKTMEAGGVIGQKQVDEVTKLTTEFGNASMSSKTFAENNKAVVNSLRNMAGAGAKLFGSSVMENMTKQVAGRKDMLSKAPLVQQRASENVAEKTAAVDALGPAKDFRAMEASLKDIGIIKSQKEQIAFLKTYGMTIHAADRLLKKETSITAARDEAKLNLENALKVQTDSTAEIKEARDALADEELILTNLTSLQERSVALQKEQIQNKINAVGVGTGTTVADKNAKLDLKNTAALTAETDKKLKSDMAIEALRVAKGQDTATAEELKGLQLTVDLAAKNLELSTAQMKQLKIEVALKKLINGFTQETLELGEKHKANAQARALLEKKNAAAIRLAGTHAEVRLLQEEKANRMRTKADDDVAKRVNLEDQLADLIKQQGYDEEDARKRKIAINALIAQELITEQMITDEINKQNGLNRSKERDRGIDSSRIKVQNMTGGAPGMLPGFGMSNITPQARELNKILAKENLTLADLDLEIHKEKKQVILEQADAQAKMGIELELANKTSDIMKQGFDSLFQSLLDGTQSFGDAMKGVMKQVLSDLAAAYMTAAAMTALRAMGLPGLPAGRYGGIMSPSGKSFAYGGVASGPQSGYQATLHGNEAVIPLGNDKSIPVHLNGGGGQNTVNVTVNMSGGQGQTQTQGDGAMQGLGRSIGGLVQQHLQQEMRPGGLLNQQGTKGRG